jgi:glucosamine-6-phosphate deaminase
MKFVIGEFEEVSKKAAEHIVNLVVRKPDAHLGLATGDTPKVIYENIVNMVKNNLVSFRHVSTYNLDEYANIDISNPQSYHFYMKKNLFSQIDILESNTHFPEINSQKSDSSYYPALENATIDLQLLGLGANGHIGFNEPLTPFASRSHRVELSVSTIESNSKFFSDDNPMPRYAFTMGIKDIMKAKEIILLATGIHKADVVKQMIEGPVTERVPASILQLHNNVTIYLDPYAASLLDIHLIQSKEESDEYNEHD